MRAENPPAVISSYDEYILDTDTCIYWLKGKEEIRKKVEQVGSDSLRMTIITLE